MCVYMYICVHICIIYHRNVCTIICIHICVQIYITYILYISAKAPIYSIIYIQPDGCVCVTRVFVYICKYMLHVRESCVCACVCFSVSLSVCLSLTHTHIHTHAQIWSLSPTYENTRHITEICAYTRMYE